MKRSAAVRLAAVVAATGLLAAGCLSDDPDGGNGGNGGGGAGDTGNGDNGNGASGGPVEIVGAFSGEQQQAFEADLEMVAEEHDLDLEFNSLADFDTIIRTRVEGGNVPDIAIFPQPGLMMDLAGDGHLIPLSEALDLDAASGDMIDGLVDTGTAEDGTTYGIPYSINVKSLVFYPIPEFDDAGYTIPESHQELVELSQQMVDDGVTPWCIGIESGPDTGWPATDWLEEYVLRVGGPDVYDQWVNNEIPFDDPVVVEAGEAFGEIALTEGFVVGGQQGLTATNFGDAANPLIADEPGCMMHRQGNFITSFWPPEILENLDEEVGVFLLPPYEGGFDGQPVLGGGDYMALLSDNPDAAAALEAIAAPSFGENSAASGGWLSPNVSFDTSFYPNDLLREQAELAADSDVFRFDGSDLMPAQVGTGTFWTSMVDWLSGSVELEEALSEIENSWP
ncbi:ABC transporter substrate-binding protein [Pseudactinotalea sp. Z1739]|uniref:ABC transporter substrate-binding protein n=1 Tax=Pseudactinotalea sp. Z1739 TaxID=3413028 RepID=UPI003C7DCDB6